MGKLYLRHVLKQMAGKKFQKLVPFFEEVRVFEDRGGPLRDCKKLGKDGKTEYIEHSLDCGHRTLVEWRGAVIEVMAWRVKKALDINPMAA